MITTAFLKRVDTKYSVEGHKLIVDFFISFARFECALKYSGFINEGSEKVTPDWPAFVKTIAETFNESNSEKLKKAVEYITQNPPKIQMMVCGQLIWKDRKFQPNEPLINKIDIHIRDIRNNLFHGGKFIGNYQLEISRNTKLLRSALIVLNEWLSISDEVKTRFLEPLI